MKRTILYSLIAAGAACGISLGQVYTTPVGYVSIECLSNSDTIVGLPLAKPSELTTTLSIDPTEDQGSATLTFNSGNLALDQFANTHYVKFTSGPADGKWYVVESNTSSAIVVDLNGDTLSAVSGDSVEVIEFWSLISLFPPGNGTIVASTNNFPAGRRTEILIPSTQVGSVNVAPQNIYFFNGGTGDWRSTSSGFPVSDNVILWPDSYFIVRHNSLSGPTNYTISGSVVESNATASLFTDSSGQTDNFLAIPRPVDVQLNELGLGDIDGPAAGFLPSTGNFPAQRGDELLVFDNTAALQNKSVSAIYFFRSTDNTWRSTASGFPIADTETIKAASGLIIRKKPTIGGQTEFWINSKNW